MSGDYISRDAALQAMWNALYALEDRQEAESGLDIMRRADVQAGFEAGQQVIAEFPAADVVEVVRCKDCIHRDPEDRKCDCGGQERQGCPLPVRGSYFCAYGKRKDGGQDDV